MIEFIQVNLKKAFLAAVELNKRVRDKKEYVILAKETYNFKGKVRSLPPKSNVICGDNPRAAIIHGSGLEIIKIEKLTNRDCAVGLIKRGEEKILIVSAYCDIKEKAVQKWAEQVVDFADKKKYAIIWGFDSNAHSTLYGRESNTRGEEIEEFLIKNSFFVENTGLVPTFEAVRKSGNITTIIDVTISRSLEERIENWRVDREYNGSDHNTILFDYGRPGSNAEETKMRLWNETDWTEFKSQMSMSKFYFPAMVKKILVLAVFFIEAVWTFDLRYYRPSKYVCTFCNGDLRQSFKKIRPLLA